MPKAETPKDHRDQAVGVVPLESTSNREQPLLRSPVCDYTKAGNCPELIPPNVFPSDSHTDFTVAVSSDRFLQVSKQPSRLSPPNYSCHLFRSPTPTKSLSSRKTRPSLNAHRQYNIFAITSLWLFTWGLGNSDCVRVSVGGRLMPILPSGSINDSHGDSRRSGGRGGGVLLALCSSTSWTNLNLFLMWICPTVFNCLGIRSLSVLLGSFHIHPGLEYRG